MASENVLELRRKQAPDTLRSAGESVGAAAPLFRPFVCGPLRLPNRIVMAPMTRAWSPDGIPTAEVAAYYARRASNEVGLIITEGTIVDHPVASPSTNVPNFFGPALDGWRLVVDAVHGAGGKIMPQLWHVGIGRDPHGPVWHKGVASIAPSGLDLDGARVTEPMTDNDVADVIEAFAKGAADAERLGFDGVEVHGAHGYLIDQFFWEKTNQRDDRFGGGAVARTRFAVEIVKAMRARVRPSFPIVMRISQWKGLHYDAKLCTSPIELSLFLEPLSDAGVDIFHVSTRRFWEPGFEGSPLPLAGWVKKVTAKPVITVGSVGLSNVFVRGAKDAASPMSVDALVERIEQNEFDLVAVGRALLADPAWARKVKESKADELKGYSPEAQRVLF